MKNQVSLIIPENQLEDTPHIFMGALYLASYLVEKGIKVKIYDEQLGEASKKIDEIVNNSFLVGFTVMTSQLRSARNLSLIMKAHNIPVVWGGVHPTLFPDQCMKENYIDYVVYDEGEGTLFELASFLINKKINIESIRGLYHKKERKIIKNTPRPYININDVSPNWDLLDVKKYPEKIFIKKRLFHVSSLHTGRGCPYKCSFCINTLLNERKWRGISAEKLINEIKNLRTYVKTNCIKFVDDNFFIDKKRLRGFCELYKNEKFNFKWIALSRLNYLKTRHIDDSLLKLLKECGCIEIRFGIESGSQRVLDEVINKGINKNDVIPIIKRLKRYNIKTNCSFMIGMPLETEKEQKETLRLIKEILKTNKNVQINGPQLYRPYPGAEMYVLAKNLGFKEPKNVEEWIKFLNDGGFVKISKLRWIKNKKKLANICKYYTFSQINPTGLSYLIGIFFKKLFQLRIKFDFYVCDIDLNLYEGLKDLYIKMIKVIY